MRHHSHWKAIVAVVICAASMRMAAPGEAAEETADKVISKSFTVEPGGTLTVDVDQGDVELLTGKQNTVSVVVEREVTDVTEGQAAKILKNHKVVCAQQGADVHVEAKSKGARGTAATRQPELTVHFRITVPKRYDARLETAGGIIEATGLQGAVEAKTSGGDMNFTNIHGLINGQSAGGNIRASGCSDKLQIRTAGGNIAIDDFTGPGAQADSAGGNIAVKGCTGPLTIKTSGGNINIENFTGPQTYADTSGGSVALELSGALLADSWVRTGGGNIAVKLGEGVAVNLNATTDGGTITTAVTVSATAQGRVKEGALEGKINGGGPKLTLKTGGGNIDILKQQ